MKKIIKALNWRAAVKKYDNNKKLTNEQVDDILEAIRLAPSAYGILPYQVLVINNPELRKQLREAGNGQSAMTDASHFLVFVVKKDLSEKDISELLDETSKVRGVPRENLLEREEKLKKSILSMSGAERQEWATRQAYLALGILLMAAAVAGIDATPMERLETEKYDKILGLTGRGLKTVVTVALGFRDEGDDYVKLPKVRMTKEKIFQQID